MKNRRICMLFLCAYILLSVSSIFSEQLQDDRSENKIYETDNPSFPVQILAISDFHGHLEGRQFLNGKPAGSGPVLASYLEWAKEEAEGPTFIVHNGDMAGASPPISALLKDEPAIMFLNLLGNKACTPYGRLNPECNVIGVPGNHEFDEGREEFMRLAHGGSHPKGPFIDDPFSGAHFPYIAANVVDEKTNQPIFPPFTIRWIKDIPLAFIGIILKEAPSLVSPKSIETLRFLDEIETVNQNVKRLKNMGVRAIIVSIHKGGHQDAFSGPTPDEPKEIKGEIVPILYGIDEEVDVVITGHTHAFTNTFFPRENGKRILVVQAYFNGLAYADIDLEISKSSHDITFKSAAIVPTYADAGPGLFPHTESEYLITDARTSFQTAAAEVVGEAGEDIPRAPLASGESALGNLIADAQREVTKSDFAFMNPGGVRSDLKSGTVTWKDLFNIQPFGDRLVTLELTGGELHELLNQQWTDQPFPRILHISGFKYAWSKNLPEDKKIINIDQNGKSIDKARVYRVTVNSFLASGGDGFTLFKKGKKRVVSEDDLSVLIQYIKSLPQPFTYTTDGRIRMKE